MHIPRPPPKPSDAAKQQGANLMIHRPPWLDPFLSEANAGYYYWDKLQHRPLPSDVTPEVAWLLVHSSRMAQRTELPLVDPEGRSFWFCLPSKVLETLHWVDRRRGILPGTDEDGATSLDALKAHVAVSSLIDEAIATSQIEGAATTRKVAKDMLQSNRKPRDRSERMIVNSYQTMQRLRDRLDRPLTIALLFEIQESMTRDTLDEPDCVGRFRSSEDDIAVVEVSEHRVLFVPPPAEQLPGRMKRLVDFANEESTGDSFIHPLVKAAILHFWLAYEHPFVDGNGRTARAIFYWFMLKHRYSFFEFLTVSRVIRDARVQYYNSFLHTENDHRDVTYSILFMLRATLRAFGVLDKYLQEKQAEQSSVAAILRKFSNLNPRQREVFAHAATHPSELCTFQSHARAHKITLMTSRSDLLGLVDRGLFAETGRERPREFFVAKKWIGVHV